MMKEELAEADYPDIKLVDTVYGDDDDQTSFDKTAALLQAYPDLKGIISPTTVGIAAAARYLSGSEYKGKVALTGLGTPNQMREYVKDGTVTAFALWNPADLGYLAGYAAPAPSPPARSPARRATRSRPASSASTPSATTASSARRPVRVQRREHRRVRLLGPRRLPGSDPFRPDPRGSRAPSKEPLVHASASPCRSGRTGWTSTAERHAAVWPEMLAALTDAAGTTTRSSCARTACSSATW